MSSTHTIDATIPVGDADEGADIDVRITFTYQPHVREQGPSYASGGQPAEPTHAEWGSAVQLIDGKPSPYSGAYADLQQGTLDSIAADWLESEDGQAQACEQALDDLQSDEDEAAERRAEQRAEDRWNA